jgi:hypothetical protein
MRILTVLLLCACSRDEQPATDEVTEPEPVVVLPTLTVSSPERGSFVEAGSVELSGVVGAGSAALAGLKLNGTTSISLASDGAFSAPIGLSPGINILGLRAEDLGGERAVDGRAVYAGPLNPPGELLAESVRMQLGPDVLDDDEDDLDDVAGIAEYMLEESDVAGAIVGQTIETSYADVTPTSLSYGAVEVNLVPVDGAILAEVILYDLWMDFEAETWVLSTTGSIWADAAVLTTRLSISGDTVTPSNTVFDLEGYGGEIDWLPDAILTWAEEYLEEEIATTTEDMVSELLGEYLGAFSVDTELLEGVSLSVALSDADASTDGLLLMLDAAVSSTAGSLPAGAGSAITDGRAPDWPLSDSPFSLAVDDDLVNQILFALWGSGALSGFEYGGTELIALTGSEIAPPLGPLERLTLDMGLPPMLGGATQDDMDADIALGEWRMAFFREDGEELTFSVNVRVGAQVSFSDADELSLALDNRPSMITMEIGVMSWPDALDPGDLASLIRLMVPPLLGNADNFLPGIGLPPIDLGSFSESLSGIELTPQDLALTVDDGGWIVLDGGFSK